jgi:hypothetical protein
MNKYDTIMTLADTNSRYFRPLREEETKDIKIPFFSISKNDLHRHVVTMHNFENHDNAPRMPFYCAYIRNHVIPQLPRDIDIAGYYPIELHDTYTYLENPKYNYESGNVLTFAKDKSHRHPCLIPDPYMIENFGGKLQIKDDVPFEKKINRVCFVGGTTGSMDPIENQRLMMADWALDKPFAFVKISNVVQLKEDMVRRAYAKFDQMVSPLLSIPEQHHFKYLMSVDGNTACWDRLVWIANSKSLLMKYKSDQVLWYYPMFVHDQHYVEVTKNNLEQKYMFYENNPSTMQWIVSNANHFASSYVNHVTSLMYTARLFENFSESKA